MASPESPQQHGFALKRNNAQTRRADEISTYPTIGGGMTGGGTLYGGKIFGPPGGTFSNNIFKKTLRFLYNVAV